LLKQKVNNFCIEAGGDIQVSGQDDRAPWIIGIRNPFKTDEIIKKVKITSQGVATSGAYIRGQHIYNPHNPKAKLTQVKSLTVIAKNIFEADRFATGAFAMGTGGIEFIKKTPGLEGYMVTANGLATYTSGFERYIVNA
jgi:thiamine biosynthesis lipoprotein